MKLKLLGLILLSHWVCFAQNEKKQLEIFKVQEQRDDFEYLKTRNPYTGIVPKSHLYDQMEMLRLKEEEHNLSAKTEAVSPNDKWVEVGAINKGGRVRSLAIINDGGKKLAFAGGVSGGLWTCPDISVSSPQWRRINDYWDNLNVSCIVVHPSNANIIFLGTGDGWRNPVNNNNSPIPSASSSKGGGIWKSIDKGKTWTRLNSTKGTDFEYIQRMLFDNNGYLYVGTLKGLFRSTATSSSAGGNPASGTQGLSWSQVLDANQTFLSVCDIEKASNGTLFVSTGIWETGNILRSSNGTTWESVPLPSAIAGNRRIELATVPNQPSVLFASVQEWDGLYGIIRTDNAMNANLSTITWSTTAQPTIDFNPSNETFEQVWAHQALIVDPSTQSNTPVGNIVVYAGYENLWRSSNGGANFTRITTEANMHVDQQWFVFDAGNLYACNDGGIYRCTNLTANPATCTPINNNLFISQFYTCAGAGNLNVYLAGSQDNSTAYFSSSGFTNGATYGTGDGAYCHFDDNYNNFIVSDQMDKILSYVGTNQVHNFKASFPNAIPNSWLFITPTELDKQNDILYVSGENNTIYRVNNVFSTSYTIDKLTIADMVTNRASALKISPNDPTTLYIGTEGGRILKLTNANTASSNPSATPVLYGTGYVSAIDIKTTSTTTDTELACSYSSYGVASIFHVLLGQTSTSIDNSTILGDIPVRTVLFAPDNNTQGIKLMIGTDLGIYTTDQINGLNTPWTRFPINQGMPYVRVDMLKLVGQPASREVIAATFGRGLMRSRMFANNKLDFTVNTTTPGSDCPITFTANVSGFTYTNNATIKWEVWRGALGSGTLLYSGTGSTYTLNNWDLDMNIFVIIENGISPFQVYEKVGKPLYYMVTVNNSVSCGGGSPTNPNKTATQALTVYPNPSDGVFHFDGVPLISNVKVFNLQGMEINNIRFDDKTLDLNNLDSGIYLYRAETEDGMVYCGKLVKE